ncbi:MAG: MbnP family protein [Cyclobacteriaceae bacterium]|nr:MbnP family protein [Cyclobacteriaceae bacterium]
MNRVTLFLFGLVFLAACNNHHETTHNGRLAIQFEHYADGQPVHFDSMMYVNAAGNLYEVSEIQWFISDIALVTKDGSTVSVDDGDFAHYVDTNIPQTLRWDIDQDLLAGEYAAIKMTFGIKGEKNKPNIFTDLPESNMVWPMHMGGDQGGYHYMKLNGFWKNSTNERQPFNFHLGVGQQRNSGNEITGFIQNWFEIEIPASAFILEENKLTVIGIRMNVEKWWESPNIYDHNAFGGSIMNNQEAMGKAAENGRKVFSFSGILADSKI